MSMKRGSSARVCGQPLPFVEEFVHLGSVQSTDIDLGTKSNGHKLAS